MMTQAELQELKAALVATALYYGETLPSQVIPIYAADLADLELMDCLTALQAYRRNARNRRRPLPADIRTLVQGDASSESRARDIAARLHGALVRYGMDWQNGYLCGGKKLYPGGGQEWSTWREAAVAELGGADALEVLTRIGGWSGYYQYANCAEPTIVAAQMRDLAASVGRIAARPALPSAEAPRALQESGQQASSGDLVRGLAERMSAAQSEERGA